MVWIHGGGFTSGSNKTDMYGPDYLVTENVVLVTINYRLGCLGRYFWIKLSKTLSNCGFKELFKFWEHISQMHFDNVHISHYLKSKNG